MNVFEAREAVRGLVEADMIGHFEALAIMHDFFALNAELAEDFLATGVFRSKSEREGN